MNKKAFKVSLWTATELNDNAHASGGDVDMDRLRQAALRDYLPDDHPHRKLQSIMCRELDDIHTALLAGYACVLRGQYDSGAPFEMTVYPHPVKSR